ncbi:DUF6338 family protein [Pseudomonas putida]|uniref:DUF6338 family protein n=1 Tax=Pseudomonas putida TaxID=303 RepID=UPI00066CA48D|nr:DUF6338 family protein [Pseudomonas putida]
MEEIPTQVIATFQALLPGFVATMIFYWLAEAAKPTQFERIIQALVCSGLIKLLMPAVEAACLWVGQWKDFGYWSKDAEAIWPFGLAVIIGLLLARFAFKDTLYRLARFFRLTSRQSSPLVEWRSAFELGNKRAIVLNLLDGRRLMGFPTLWPSDAKAGHFLIDIPHWIDNGQIVPYTGVKYVLISNEDVLWVEFLD